MEIFLGRTVCAQSNEREWCQFPSLAKPLLYMQPGRQIDPLDKHYQTSQDTHQFHGIERCRTQFQLCHIGICADWDPADYNVWWHMWKYQRKYLHILFDTYWYTYCKASAHWGNFISKCYLTRMYKLGLLASYWLAVSLQPMRSHETKFEFFCTLTWICTRSFPNEKSICPSYYLFGTTSKKTSKLRIHVLNTVRLNRWFFRPVTSIAKTEGPDWI